MVRIAIFIGLRLSKRLELILAKQKTQKNKNQYYSKTPNKTTDSKRKQFTYKHKNKMISYHFDEDKSMKEMNITPNKLL